MIDGAPIPLVPAEAGTQIHISSWAYLLGSRLRGNERAG
jgi:hypothetical protein